MRQPPPRTPTRLFLRKMGNYFLFLVIAVGMGCAALLPLPVPAAEPRLLADFETDPIQAGWTPHGSARYGTNVLWSTEDPHTGTHCLEVRPTPPKRGSIGWESPPFQVEEGQLYRLAFWARTTSPAFWQITFQDATGAQTEGDHNSQIAASDGWAFHEHFFRAKYPGVTATLWFYVTSDAPLGIDEVRVKAATENTAALAAADRRWQEMRPAGESSTSSPKPISGPLLPKRDKNGPYRVVLLGDSIANDLSNSSLPLLLEQASPGSQVDCRFTGRGGTSWLKHQFQIEQRILQHQPDLLVLLAVSNDEEWMEAPLNRIIDECRLKSPQTDIVLVTPHLKRWNPRREDGLLQRERILAIGKAKNVDVFDLQTVWADYLTASGRPPESLLRDGLHLSETGRELSARAFVDYLVKRRGAERCNGN